jgi:hypothetical protein
MREVLRQKIADALVTPPPPMTRRDVRLPGVRGKALAVIGMRRSGKTTFLWQCLGDRLAAGAPRESLLYFSFEDERLAGPAGGGASARRCGIKERSLMRLGTGCPRPPGLILTVV